MNTGVKAKISFAEPLAEAALQQLIEAFPSAHPLELAHALALAALTAPQVTTTSEPLHSEGQAELSIRLATAALRNPVQ